MGKVGILGAGVMGLASAAKLLQEKWNVAVFDVSQNALARAREMGAETAGSPRELAEACEIALMFLPGPVQVADCVTGPQGLLAGARPGLVIVDMSTVDPGTTEAMAAAAKAQGAQYLDAPVLGRPAAIGAWALPVGGEAGALEKCRPVLSVLAKNIMHVGPAGTGNKIKLLNQMMFGAINAMTAEMMAVADLMGIPPKKLYETITASQAGTVSNLFKELGGRIARDDYQDPTFSVNLLIKDVHLAVEMARQNGARPILGQTVEFLNQLAKSQGQGDLDTSAMWKCLRKMP